VNASHGFGIVGAGVIAATHAEAIASLPGARLAAVTDVDAQRAAALAAATGADAEPGLDELLGRPDVDVVCVCVPSGMHAEVGVRAAAAGKHLVIEKPIDVTLAAADRLLTTAADAGVAVTVISQHRFDRGLTELRGLLDAGALGRLVFGEASTKWYRSQGYYDSAAWRGTWALDGGALMNQGIHYVDLLRWCAGPVTEVTALCQTSDHQLEAEDVALALLRFASGAAGTIIASTAMYPGFPQRLELAGTGGTVVIENGEIVHRALLAGRGGQGGGSGGSQGPAGPDTADGTGGTSAAAAADPAAVGTSSHAAQIADLLAAVEVGRPPSVTGQDGRDALEIVCAVYQSAREGRTITLPAAAGAGHTPGAAPHRESPR
jgi:UDP-N-acetyl-2-amino-2-deoxyglucuronate dehydrogenase